MPFARWTKEKKLFRWTLTLRVCEARTTNYRQRHWRCGIWTNRKISKHHLGYCLNLELMCWRSDFSENNPWKIGFRDTDRSRYIGKITPSLSKSRVRVLAESLALQSLICENILWWWNNEQFVSNQSKNFTNKNRRSYPFIKPSGRMIFNYTVQTIHKIHWSCESPVRCFF